MADTVPTCAECPRVPPEADGLCCCSHVQVPKAPCAMGCTRPSQRKIMRKALLPSAPLRLCTLLPLYSPTPGHGRWNGCRTRLAAPDDRCVVTSRRRCLPPIERAHARACRALHGTDPRGRLAAPTASGALRTRPTAVPCSTDTTQSVQPTTCRARAMQQQLLAFSAGDALA
jgi:hypothetical protein